MAYFITIHPCSAIIFLLFLFSPIEAQYNDGFTVKLIPKNSSRVSYNLETAQAPISSYRSEYLMELSIGTPPKISYAILDTGSDLIWFQCVPCTNCYQQQNPLFDPRSSSSYTDIQCGSKLCHKLRQSVCSPDQRPCDYNYFYADKSTTSGVLAQETLTLTSTIGKPLPFKDIIFGCGHNNSGTFNDHEMGLIGLGRGITSLIYQIGSSVGGKMFSQCLVPLNNDPSIISHMSFGKGSQVLGINGVVSTPMVSKLGPLKTKYCVTLLGISVEGINVPYSNGSPQEPIAKGNMVIDSGTPATTIPEQFYQRLFEQVRSKIALEPLLYNPSLGYELCYQTQTNLQGPTLTAHFDGADVLLTPTQIFIPVADGVFCFAFMKSFSDQFGIYGNYAQSNYLIGFDLEREIVSFKPMDCKNNFITPTSSSPSPKMNPTFHCCLLVLILITIKLFGLV